MYIDEGLIQKLEKDELLEYIKLKKITKEIEEQEIEPLRESIIKKISRLESKVKTIRHLPSGQLFIGRNTLSELRSIQEYIGTIYPELYDYLEILDEKNQTIEKLDKLTSK